MFNENYCLDIATRKLFVLLNSHYAQTKTRLYITSIQRIVLTLPCVKKTDAWMTYCQCYLFSDRLVLFVLLVEHVFHDFEEGRLSDQMFDKTHYSA